MQGAPGYEASWEIVARAISIRPSTEQEVVTWLNSHRYDVAQWCWIAGKTLRVVLTSVGLALEDPTKA